MIDEKLK